MFMFSYGILIETRVFGELIPFVVCSSALILEQSLVAKMQRRDEHWSSKEEAVSSRPIGRAA